MYDKIYIHTHNKYVALTLTDYESQNYVCCAHLLVLDSDMLEGF